MSVFCPERRAAPSTFWQEEDDRYGWFHQADRSSPRFRAGVLLVFVHGIFGESRGTWGETPFMAMQAARIDADAFSFRFPASLTEDADVEVAGDHLATALREKFRRYRHLFFCVHSTGGLVVKAALLGEANELLKEVETRPQDFRFLESAVLRTRRILNLDVPHAGGEYWRSRLGGFAYKWIVRPLLHVLRAVGVWPHPVGFNKIVSQLEHENHWVLDLERRYISLVQTLDAKGLPRPVSIEFLSDDKAIAPFDDVIIEEHAGKKVSIRSDAEQIRVRGNHLNHKFAIEDTDMIAGLLAKRLHGAVHHQTLALATQTLALIYDYERALRLLRLVGDVSSGSVSPLGDTIGTQACIEARIRALIAEGAQSVRSFVITGDAGVGKSVVIRRVARTLGLHHVNRDNDSQPLPIVIPLQRVKFKEQEMKELDGSVENNAVWKLLAEDWCGYVNGILERDRVPRKLDAAVESRMPRLDPEWLHHRLLDHPAVLIFDGVDEFLSNNVVGFKKFHDMLRRLQADYARNTSLTIFLGVRSSQGGIETLAGGKKNIYRVRRMELSEADSIYRGAKDWIERFPTKELRDLVLTPLILTQLGPRLDVLQPESLSSRAAILEAALDAILEKTDLELPEPARERRAIEADQWKDALSLVAWRYHAGVYATMNLEQLRAECETTLGRGDGAFAIDKRLTWLTLLKPPVELTTKYKLLGETNPAMQKFVENIRLATSPSILEVIMRTIFFPTDEMTFRFLHREWQDFLASRYLADCVRYNHTDELSDHACTQSMFRMAGDLLGDMTINSGRIQLFLGRSADLKTHYVIGNFVAVINNSLVKLEGPALGLIFAAFDSIEGIAKHVTLAGLGYRVLNAHMQPDGDKRDPTARAIRNRLAPLLRKLAALENYEKTLPITIHMARCYLVALAEGLPNGVESDQLGPALTERSLAHDETTLLQIATKNGNMFDLTTPHRSVQRAFLQIQTLVADSNEPARPIAVVHYLFFLTLAHFYDAGISELHEELPKLLGSGTHFEAEIEKYNLAPLTALYRQCQKMIASPYQSQVVTHV